MKTRYLTQGAAAVFSVLYTSSASAIVHPNGLFSDGAVLQRGQSVPVWGTAADGENVTVEIAGQKVSTKAEGGKWRVDLEPLSEGTPLTMTVTGENTVMVKNLLVGEVWICSGQSNMEFKFSQADRAEEERPKANFPEIRMFTVQKTIAAMPESEVKGNWVMCSPETVDGFSAVGYFFARDLYQKLGVPIGMINSSWGGTPAQAWTSPEGFGDYPELKEYVDMGQRAIADGLTPGKKLNQNSPNTLYNGMLAPVIPYGIKGAIWYQGESNAGKAKQYRTLFPAMITDWRTKWDQGDFPFLFVQIAPFKKQPPEIREAQFLTLSKSENTAMAVTTDVGNSADIHPKKKEPVGARLALAARALAYSEKVEYSGPLYDSVKIDDKAAIVSFTHTGGGLLVKDGDLRGFTIAGADGNFLPAKAEISGQTVVVSAESVSNPKAVRYGWENVPDVNLFNKEGLPASPFRSDVD